MRSLRALGLLVLAIGSAAITRASLVYFDADEYAPFVLEKLELPLPSEQRYLLALQTHVIAAAVALPACLALLSRTLLRRAPRVHRWLGRLTGGVTVLALAPSGFYLSLYAKGGLAGTLGFMLSGAIVVVAMVCAVREARARRFAAHRRFVLHVVAQMAVAVISRAMLVLAHVAGYDHEAAYLVSLWIPVVCCAAAVECLAGPVVPFRRNHASSRDRRALAPARAELDLGRT